jgi:hypothetical protein
MSFTTINRGDYKDFKVVSIRTKNHRSKSQEHIDENQTMVTAEVRKVKGNDSKEFMSTLSIGSPYFNQSSYRTAFKSFGESKYYKS